MASIRKKIGSAYWYACFNLPDGTRTQRSTKLIDRKSAQKLAHQWEEASQKRVTESQARKVLADIYENIHGQPLLSATFEDYADQWLARKKGETTTVTFKAYVYAVEEFKISLEEKAQDQIHYVTVADIARWRDASSAKASATTANNKLKILRTLFQSAWRDGLVPENPAAKVQSLKTENSTRRAFSMLEIKAVLKAANFEWQGMVLAGVYTGQRLKDIASLTSANLDLEQDLIRLSTSKTGRHQIIPIAVPFRSYLLKLNLKGDSPMPLFPEAFKVIESHDDVSSLSQQFHEILVAAGLLTARSTGKGKSHGQGRDAPRHRTEISFHSLRHTATSMLKNAGVSEAVARDIIGHDSAEVSRHYTHMDEKTKKAAIELLPDVTLDSAGASKGKKTKAPRR